MLKTSETFLKCIDLRFNRAMKFVLLIFLVTMLISNAVKEKLDECFSRSFRVCSDTGDLCPHVCCVCDRFTKTNDIDIISLKDLKKYRSLLKPNVDDIDEDLLDCYQLEIEEDKENVLDGLMLSPRGCFVQQDDRRKKDGITTCIECKSSLRKNQVPRFAIVNGNFVGTPPRCLLELTEVELAFLTPAFENLLQMNVQ